MSMSPVFTVCFPGFLDMMDRIVLVGVYELQHPFHESFSAHPSTTPSHRHQNHHKHHQHHHHHHRHRHV